MKFALHFFFVMSMMMMSMMSMMLLLMMIPGVAAFAPFSSRIRLSSSASSSTTLLRYLNGGDDNSHNNNNNTNNRLPNHHHHPNNSNNNNNNHNPPRTPRTTSLLTLPILGPWVEQAPLLPGGTMELHDPTPMQAQSLQLAIDKQHDMAAPIVAVLDHYTIHTPDPGRYATLAAVVGYTEKKKTTAESSSSTEYFMEAIRSPTPPVPQRSVRLLGIGRALLTNICYESTKKDAMDEDGYLLECEVNADEDESVSACDNAVIVGNVQIVQDHFDGMAPVQAITECAYLTEQVSHWHSERQRLVQMIAQEDAVFKDWDGIGDLFTFNLDCISTPRSHLEQLENYGLGSSSSSSSSSAMHLSIKELTQNALQALSPYYSPAYLATEDFYYQVASWAALAALSCYVKPPHLAWAVRCTDTTERLAALEDWMHSHVKLLRQCLPTPSSNR